MVVKTHLAQLERDAGFVERRVRDDLRRGHMARHRIKRDLQVPVDHAAAEFDRRNVPLAGRAQAHDETLRAVREPALIRMRDDRRVEQRRAFQGVFAGEIRADQELTRSRQLAVGKRNGLALA